MAISYPLDFPTNKGLTRVVFGALTSSATVSSPYTFQMQVQESLGELWTVDISLPLMSREDAELWITFLLKLRGKKGTFLFGDPYGREPRGHALGSPVVNGGSQVGETLEVAGFPANAGNLLLAGDYIQIENSLYKVLDDVSSDSLGFASIEIFPRIKISPPDSATIIMNNAKGLFRLTQNKGQYYEITNPIDSGLYSLGFSAIEAL